MPDTYNYPAEIERDEDGRHVVSFPDFGWGATDGATRDEALLEAKDLLRELIATTIREGEDLPEPSRAGKGEAPRRATGSDRAEGGALRGLAPSRDFATPTCARTRRRRERGAANAESEHSTKVATIDRALRRLGKRVTVTVGEAA